MITAPLPGVGGRDACAPPRSPIGSSRMGEAPNALSAGIDELLILICEIAALEAHMGCAGVAGRACPAEPPVASRRIR